MKSLILLQSLLEELNFLWSDDNTHMSISQMFLSHLELLFLGVIANSQQLPATLYFISVMVLYWLRALLLQKYNKFSLGFPWIVSL